MKKGDKVIYIKEGATVGTPSFEKGIIKRMHPDFEDKAWVVYHCNEDWDNYENYTGALTNLRDLQEGWDYVPPRKDYNITTREDDVVYINMGKIELIIKHNDIGISIEDQNGEDIQVFFDDYEN